MAWHQAGAAGSRLVVKEKDLVLVLEVALASAAGSSGAGIQVTRVGKAHTFKVMKERS